MLEKLAEENARIQEAQAKVAEKNNNFKTESEKQLVEKMSKVEVQKKTKLEALKTKMQEHVGYQLKESFLVLFSVILCVGRLFSSF